MRNLEIDQRRELAAALYGAGLGLAAVADVLGVSSRTVIRDLETVGVTRRRRGRRSTAPTGTETPARPLDLDEAATTLRSRYALALEQGEPVRPADLIALARLEILLENRRLFEEARALTTSA